MMTDEFVSYILTTEHATLTNIKSYKSYGGKFRWPQKFREKTTCSRLPPGLEGVDAESRSQRGEGVDFSPH